MQRRLVVACDLDSGSDELDEEYHDAHEDVNDVDWPSNPTELHTNSVFKV